MDGVDDLRSVRELRKEKREKTKSLLPKGKSAQKEYLRDFLARNQENFEIAMGQLLEYDPKSYATIYKDLMKHMIPKQSEMSVTHGLDEDFKELMALGRTKVNEDHLLDIDQSPMILDTDYEEIKPADYGSEG